VDLLIDIPDLSLSALQQLVALYVARFEADHLAGALLRLNFMPTHVCGVLPNRQRILQTED
jgi:hypothetical protein